VKRQAWAKAGLVVLAVVAIDQAVKALVRAGVERGSEDSIFLGVKLVHVGNRGVAFGAFSDGGALVVILVGGALTLLLVYFATNAGKPLLWLPTGLLLGGALGNLVDRVFRGEVTDFIKIPLWPAFNVADISITFGVLSLLYVLEAPRARARRRA
jgi:signal peptidase II